jgi:hypothetical protein
MKPNPRKGQENERRTRIPRIHQRNLNYRSIFPPDEQIRHLLITLISTLQGLFSQFFPPANIVLPSTFAGGNLPRNNPPNTNNPRSEQSINSINSSNTGNSDNNINTANLPTNLTQPPYQAIQTISTR